MDNEKAGSNEMTLKEAQQRHKFSREAHWSFPTSLGRPVPWDNPGEWVARMIKERDSFSKAVTLLVRNEKHKEAMEVAANIWRIWILARDEGGGRKFLILALKCAL